MSRTVYLVGASLPRSGHHFLEALLRRALGSDFAYCGGGRINECCGHVICTRPRDTPVFLRKSHDEDLKLPTDLTDIHYVIQHRAPIGRMLSLVEFRRRRHGAAFAIEDRGFATRSLARDAIYAVDFCRKWLQRAPPNAIVIDYAELKSATVRVVSSLLERIGYPMEEEALSRSIELSSVLRASDRTLTAPYVPRNDALSPYLATDLLGQYDTLVRSELPEIWGAPQADAEPSPIRRRYDRIRLERKDSREATDIEPHEALPGVRVYRDENPPSQEG